MKKTLITLAALAMASAASAATPVASYEYGDTAPFETSSLGQSYTLTVLLDWNAAVNPDTGLSTWGETLSGAPHTTIEVGGSGTGMWWKSGLGLLLNGEGGKVNVDITYDGSHYKTLSAGADNDANDGVTVNAGTYSGADFILDSSYNLDGKLVLAYTFVLDTDAATENNQYVQTLYALKNDGTLSAVQVTGENGWYNESTQGPVDFNGFNVSDAHTSISNIDVYAGELTQAQLKYAMQTSIPEPATATLSLLALAGLAARRRRK